MPVDLNPLLIRLLKPVAREKDWKDYFDKYLTF